MLCWNRTQFSGETDTFRGCHSPESPHSHWILPIHVITGYSNDMKVSRKPRRSTLPEVLVSLQTSEEDLYLLEPYSGGMAREGKVSNYKLISQVCLFGELIFLCNTVTLNHWRTPFTLMRGKRCQLNAGRFCGTFEALAMYYFKVALQRDLNKRKKGAVLRRF